MMIIEYPNTILKERMPEFDFTNPIVDPVQLEKDMLEIMYNNYAIGLAANQIGIRTRMFVMGHENHRESGMGFFNPVVLETTNEVEDLEEGCLSFPGIVIKIKRPTAIKARWQTFSGELMEGVFENYDCKCFLHELDHLEGIVFKDRVSSLKWNMSIKKSKRRQ